MIHVESSVWLQNYLVQQTVESKDYTSLKGRGAAFESGYGDVYAGAEELLCHHYLA